MTRHDLVWLARLRKELYWLYKHQRSFAQEYDGFTIEENIFAIVRGEPFDF